LPAIGQELFGQLGQPVFGGKADCFTWAEKPENCFSIPALPQNWQRGAFEEAFFTSFSVILPQSRHLYSYMGIVAILT